MSAHLSNEIVERFHRQSLTGADRGAIYNHVLGCETCRGKVVTSQTAAVALRTLTDHMLPQEGDEPFHLDPATIDAFVNDTLDPLDRSTVKLHLEDCQECADEVNDFRESLATMKAASREHRVGKSVAIPSPDPRTRFSVPMRIAAAVALITFTTIALIVLYKWRTTSILTTEGSPPTPSASPQAPGVVPSPALATSPQLVENPPGKGPVEKEADVIAVLKDGSNEITLDRSGNVSGLPSVPSESRDAVKEALSGEPIARPAVLDEIATAAVSERGTTGNEERIRIAGPTNRVIVETQPTLRWNLSKTAEAYRVEIADATFHQIAKSEDLPATSQNWRSPTQLKRGAVYTWTIRAVDKTGQPSTISSQAKFKVLSEDKVRQINRLKASGSHIALGLLYAREGMVAEAEREFGILVKENPDSAVAKKLLKDVRSWRRR